MSNKDKERGYLGERLNGHPTTYDSDGPLGWDRMAPRLFPKKKRRAGFLWWTAAIVALVLCAGLLFRPDQAHYGSTSSVAQHLGSPPRSAPLAEIRPAGKAGTDSLGGSPLQPPALTEITVTTKPEPPLDRGGSSGQPAPQILPDDKPSLPVFEASRKTRVQVNTVPTLPLLPLPLPSITLTLPPATVLPDHREGRPSSGELGLLVGGSLPISELTGASELAEEQTIAWTASPVAGLLIGSEYVHDLGNGWRLRPGIGYQRLSQTIAYRGDEATTLYRPGTPDTIYRNTFTGTTRTVTVDSIAGRLVRDFRHTNHEDRVAVNLLVEKRTPIGTKASVSALLGAGYLIYTRRRGALPQRQGQRLNLSELPDRRQRDRFGLLAGLGASRYLSPHIRWTTHIRYQLAPGSGLQAVSLSTGLFYTW